MAVHNAEIASFFERVADLLEIEDENPFRIRAYRSAARNIRSSTVSMMDLLKEGEDLSTLPNIGKDLAEKIQVIVETGDLPLLGEIEARTPASLGELLKIRGLGPKRVKALYKQLDINTLEDLRRAVQNGKIYTVKGFDDKAVKVVMDRINSFSTKKNAPNGWRQRTLHIHCLNIYSNVMVLKKSCLQVVFDDAKRRWGI